ncbi:hypothetical protein AA313_de0204594 [Arthrobotrys entomopaga]|nr:hypothetical protein AA313_de0204594 [Arthrobotrys entomopaga]
MPAETPDVFLGVLAYHSGDVNPNDPAYLLRVEIHEGAGCQDPDPLVIDLDTKPGGYSADDQTSDYESAMGGGMEIEEGEIIREDPEEVSPGYLYSSAIEEEDNLNGPDGPDQQVNVEGNKIPAADFWKYYYENHEDEEEESELSEELEESFDSSPRRNNRLVKRAPPPKGSKQSQSSQQQQQSPFRKLDFNDLTDGFPPENEEAEPGYILESKFQNPNNGVGYLDPDEEDWDPFKIESPLIKTLKEEQNPQDEPLLTNNGGKNLDISPSVPSPQKLRIPATPFEDVKVHIDPDVSIQDPEGLLGGDTPPRRRNTLKFLMNEGRHVPESSNVDDQSVSQAWYPTPPLKNPDDISAAGEIANRLTMFPLFPVYQFEDPISFRFVFDPSLVHDVTANV